MIFILHNSLQRKILMVLLVFQIYEMILTWACYKIGTYVWFWIVEWVCVQISVLLYNILGNSYFCWILFFAMCRSIKIGKEFHIELNMKALKAKSQSATCFQVTSDFSHKNLCKNMDKLWQNIVIVSYLFSSIIFQQNKC